MERTALTTLMDWLAEKRRKPLVIRGARQIGKTWLVQRFAELAGRQLIELNFEKQPALASLFETNQPAQILLNLAALFNHEIDPDHALLFLDEIQAAPQLFAKLRWFAEDLPQLPVIATGSLLEFVLATPDFSMPVGRIGYMHLEPFSFDEFLLAHRRKPLHDWLNQFDFSTPVPAALHTELNQVFREYVLVGGMPAVVQAWVEERSPIKVVKLQHDVLATYRDDFAKYRGRLPVERLDEVILAIPKMLGQKFICSRVNPDIPTSTIKQVLNLLSKARICHYVFSTSANGVPLAAEIREKYFKMIFLDTGLCCAALGIRLNQINAENELALINRGSLAEQVVGQQLRTLFPFYIEPALYYWLREKQGANAEIDYIIEHNNTIVPVEVKAGTTGSLKSLHYFMEMKKLTCAIRINSDLPQKTAVNIANPKGKPNHYTLLSVPFYLVSQLPRLLDQC